MSSKVYVQRLVLQKAKSIGKYEYYVELLKRWDLNPLLMELEYGSDHLFLQTCVEFWLRKKKWEILNINISTGIPDLIVRDDDGNMIAIQVDTFELWKQGIAQAKRYVSDVTIHAGYVALPATVCQREDLRKQIEKANLGLIEIFPDTHCKITIPVKKMKY
jgi:hypothetical protein